MELQSVSQKALEKDQDYQRTGENQQGAEKEIKSSRRISQKIRHTTVVEDHDQQFPVRITRLSFMMVKSTLPVGAASILALTRDVTSTSTEIIGKL
jgi:hypothetical protein